MKSDKGKKFAAGVLIFVSITLVLYVAQSFYFDKTGVVETEYALNYVQEEILNVQGYAVRDEYREKDGVNTSILNKDTDKVYVPIISDSASVAVNDNIAVCFDSENQADAYIKIKKLEERKEELTSLKSFEELSKISVTYLNSQIYKTVQDYVGYLSEGNFEELDRSVNSFCNNITSKQIATGYSYDFSLLIDDCDSQITSLEALVGSKEYVSSPYAGYFVSVVDGYEQTKLYDDILSKNIAGQEAAALINSEPAAVKNAYGKIIAQHTWFMLFDVPIEQAATIKEGKTVYVDFSERGINDIPMTVYDISDVKDGIITVTLKCKYLNEELAVLRKEQLSITIAEYEGIKISNEALIKNSEGLDGVYVLSGNVATFTPIDILYYGQNYVVAQKYTAYTTDEDGNKIVDAGSTAAYRELKIYDSIIVKGTNLQDGKVIS